MIGKPTEKERMWIETERNSYEGMKMPHPYTVAKVTVYGAKVKIWLNELTKVKEGRVIDKFTHRAKFCPDLCF